MPLSSRLFRFLICLAMPITLASCSGAGDEDTSSGDQGNQGTVVTPTPSPTPSPSPSPTPDPTTPAEPTPNPTPAPSPDPVVTPTPTPNPEPAPTPTPVPPQPEPSPTPSPTPVPTPSPEPVPEPTPTPSPSPEPIPEPSPAPTPITSCPANYEVVQANASLGTTKFCIAKFEMKKDSGSTAIVTASGRPWLASKAQATEACASIGAGYRLPTNSEWNAAALEIYNQGANWTSGTKLQGTLITGFYSGWTEPVAVTNTANPYDGTRQNSGSQRRAFILASGNTIWDFAGNAWEWVSDTIYGSSYTPDLSSSYGRSYHNNSWDVKPGSKQLFDFTGMSAVPSNDVYLGNLFGGSSGKVIRGGAVCITSPGVTGIFTANIGDITGNELQAPASWNLNMNNVGFRCVIGIQ